MGHYRSRPIQVDMTCNRVDEKTGQVCGAPMVVLFNRGGAYLGCSRYPDCSNNLPLSGQGEPLWPVETSVVCPLCGRTMNIKRSRRGKFLACPGYPKCRGTLNL